MTWQVAVQQDPDGLTSRRSDAISMGIAASVVRAFSLALGVVWTPPMYARLLEEPALVADGGFIARQAVGLTMIADHELLMVSSVLNMLRISSLRRVS